MAWNPLMERRAIDIVFCIDATGDMAPHLENVKTAVKEFIQTVTYNASNSFDCTVGCLNVKIITFRDYAYDGAQAMEESEFFDLIAGDGPEFEEYLSNIVAKGGGDEAENGLEALVLAMKSDWLARDWRRDRQVIVLFTNADAHDLGERANWPGYPSDIVETELVDLWHGRGGPDIRFKKELGRLLIFAPAGTKYKNIARNLYGIFIPTELNDNSDTLQFEFNKIIESVMPYIFEGIPL